MDHFGKLLHDNFLLFSFCWGGGKGNVVKPSCDDFSLRYFILFQTGCINLLCLIFCT